MQLLRTIIPTRSTIQNLNHQSETHQQNHYFKTTHFYQSDNTPYAHQKSKMWTLEIQNFKKISKILNLMGIKNIITKDSIKIFGNPQLKISKKKVSTYFHLTSSHKKTCPCPRSSTFLLLVWTNCSKASGTCKSTMSTYRHLHILTYMATLFPVP